MRSTLPARLDCARRCREGRCSAMAAMKKTIGLLSSLLACSGDVGGPSGPGGVAGDDAPAGDSQPAGDAGAGDAAAGDPAGGDAAGGGDGGDADSSDPGPGLA